MAVYASREGSQSVFKLEWKSETQLVRRRSNLHEKKVVRFDEDEVASIALVTVAGEEAGSYVFEEKEGAWSVSKDEGEPRTAPQMDVKALLSAVANMRYDAQYELIAQNPEMALGDLEDVESTFTLRAAGGETLAGFTMTI